MGNVDSRRGADRPKPQDIVIGETPAWEMIEAGRYRPRRIKGSYPGRELG